MLHLPVHHLLRIPLVAVAAQAVFAQDAMPAPPANATAIVQNAGLHRLPGSGALRGDGSDYRAHFTASGMRFEPALGRAVATTQHLAMAPLAVRRGTSALLESPLPCAPDQRDLAAVYQHTPTLQERFDVHAAGVDVSWHFAVPPAGDGDLVVRYAIDTSLPAPRAHGGGVAFELPGIGGVAVGGVTGIDANGVRCAGTTRWVDGQLELSLPAGFVAAARYPLVLDPTIGTIVTVNTEVYDDSDPDVAYDRTNDCWLAVWLRTFSTTNVDVRGQRLDASGAPLGGLISFGSAGVAERPRVANLDSRSRFGVVWAQQDAGTNTVQFRSVAGAGGFTHSHVVVSSTTTLYHDADIGCETASILGQDRDFVVAFQAGSSIQVRRLWFDTGDVVATGALVTILQSTPLFANYSQPAIARTASDDGMLLVVARRTSVGNADQIVAVAVRTYTFLLGSNPTTTLATAASGETLTTPDVDGYGSQWIAAWHRSGNGANTVTYAPVTLAGGLAMGTVRSLSGPPGFTASSPSVGYGLGKAWLGYRTTSLLGGAGLAVRGLDATTALPGSDFFSEPVTGSENRIVVATALSGGDRRSDEAFAVFGEAANIYGQRLFNHGNGGVRQDLGGGCGANRGTQAFSHNPAIGSSGFRCTLQNTLPFSYTIFNFAPPAPTVACGVCDWLPFSVTVGTTTDAGNPFVEFPIPYQQALVGAQFETQWTTLHGTQTPCPLVPGLVISNRWRLTIGQ